METQLKLKLIGTTVMLQHNGQLSNPLNPHTQAVASISKKRNKTAEDIWALAITEARGSFYETSEGHIALPLDNVWRSIYDAAKMYKLGTTVKKALVPSGEVVPLLIGGAPVKADDWLLDASHILYASVKVGTSRVMRARPLIPAGWEAEVQFTLLKDVLDEATLGETLKAAGRLFGVGDWRPKYGQFRVEVL